MSFCIPPVAFFAKASLVNGVAGILRVVGMALWTVGDGCFLSSVIFSLGDRFKVRRIHTVGYATEMIEM